MPTEPPDLEFELGEAVAALREIAGLLHGRGCDVAIEIAERALAARMSRFVGGADVVTGMASVRIAKPDGEGKGWLKQVTAVDRNLRHGYAFQGPFLEFGQIERVPIGAPVLGKWVAGDKSTTAKLWIAQPEGLALIQQTQGRNWWRQMRSALVAMV